MSDERQNELLAALSPSNYALLRPHLTRINLEQHAVLQESGRPIENIYFPLDGMVSLVAIFPTGEEVEIAAVGREGAVGTKVGLLPQLAFATAIVQLPGTALRMSLAKFQEIAIGNIAITHIATCANDVMTANLQQAAACNAVHQAEPRLARWLLHAHRRSQSDVMPLTQEFIAQMLGVRRTTVSMIARTLEARGLIKYTRGKIQIVDLDGLLKLACNCYLIVEKNIDAVAETARLAKNAD